MPRQPLEQVRALLPGPADSVAQAAAVVVVAADAVAVPVRALLVPVETAISKNS